MSEQQITPFKIQRVDGKNHKIVKVHRVPNKQAGFDPLDPMRAANAKNMILFIEKIRQTAPNK